MKSYIRCLALTVAALVGVSAVGQAVEKKTAPASQPTTMTMTKTGTYTVTVTTTVAAPSSAAKPAVGMGDWTFTITPADEPRPALKYQLFPMYLDRKPGNAVLMIDQAMQMVPRPEGDNSPGTYKDGDRIEVLRDMPLEQIRAPQPVIAGTKGAVNAAMGIVRYPIEGEIQDIVGAYSMSLDYMEVAAFRRDADWGLPYEKGISMLMPSLSSIRQTTKVLALKARLEIAQGQYDQAVKTLETGYSVAEHVAGPTLINSLITVAMEALLNQQLMTMVQQTDSPNMYWAMASLPRSMGKMEQAIEYERNWLYAQFPELKDYKNLTPDQWRTMIRKVEALMRSGAVGDQPKLAIVGVVAANVGAGREYLAEHGYAAEQIKKMTPSQIVGLYFMDDWNYWWDQSYKWWLLPYGKSREGAAQTNKELQKRIQEVPGSLMAMLMPSLAKARTLQARADRAVASLITVEAIRMYA